MAVKIEANVPDPLREDLEFMAAETGSTLSATIIDCLTLGLAALAENRNKVEVFKNMRKKSRRVEDSE